jgi:hypothetical protein
MILVADASVAAPVVVHLRSIGHEITAVREIAPAMRDDDGLALAGRLGAVLLT